MPDLVTHYYFANKLYENLPKEIKKKISNKDLYIFASAGPDPLFFYKFLKFKENKKIADIGHYMHENKIFDYFKNLVDITKASDNPDFLFAYLAGFINHHALDSTVHPYVFYKTGLFVANDKETYLYHGLHTKLERALDSYIIRNIYRQNPNKYNIVCEVLNLRELPQQLKEPFDELYQMFEINNGFDIINQSVKDQRKFYKFIYDPFGIKNFFFRILDSKKMPTSLKVLSYYNKEITNLDFLNLENKIWYNPSDQSIKSDLSVLQLIDKALIQANFIITEVYNYIYQDKTLDENILPRTSYLDGLNEGEGKMEYFDIIFK